MPIDFETKYPTLDREIAAVLSNSPEPAVFSTIEEERVVVVAGTQQLIKGFEDRIPSDGEYRLEDRTIPVENGEIKVRCLIPTPTTVDEQPDGPYPLFVWYHGGGYVFGTIDGDDYILREICVKHNVVVLNVDYRLAPEHPYPTSIDDGYAAAKWASENQRSLNASTTLGYIVGGSSAGANLAATVALRARDDPFFTKTPLTGQLLQIPWLLHSNALIPERFKNDLKSLEENADAPVLTRQSLDRFLELLQVPNPNDPLFSVILAKDHANLPSAFVQVSGLDPLRDEGLLYEKLLKGSGVRTKLELYPSMPHAGHFLAGSAAVSKKCIQDWGAGIAWLLDSTRKG